MRRWPAVALLISAVLYNSWLLQPWLNPGMTAVNAYASELAARNQPGGAAFRLSDVAAGACALAAGITLAIFSRSLFRAGWAGVAVFGIATMFDGGVTTLDCSPSTDRVCEALGDARRLPLTHQLHPVSSGLALGGILVAAICLTLAVGRAGPAGVRPRRIGLVLCGALAVTTVAVEFAAALGSHPVGVWGRLQILVMTGVLVWSAWLASPARFGP